MKRLLQILRRRASPDLFFAGTFLNRHSRTVSNRFWSVTLPSNEIEPTFRSYSKKQFDVYIRTTLLRCKPNKGRGDKELSAGASVVWVDVDRPPDEVLSHPLLRDTPPSIAIGSGNGVHLYFALDSFERDLDQIESANRWLAQQLTADDCWDAAHILRVPDTMNWKDRDNPKPVEVLVTNDVEYSLSDFPHPDEPTQRGSPTLTLPTAEPLPDDFLDSLGERLRKRITRPPRKDRSSNDWHTCVSLLNLNFTPGQLVTILTHEGWAISNKSLQKGPDYVARTIKRALDEQMHEQRLDFPLSKILNPILFTVDSNGVKKRAPGLRGGDIATPVIRYLRRSDTQFLRDPIEDVGYIVDENGLVLTADVLNQQFTDWLYTQTGYTEAETEHRQLKCALAIEARTHGLPVKPKPWAGVSSGVFNVLIDDRQVVHVHADSSPSIELNGLNGSLIRKSAQVRGTLRKPDTLSPFDAVYTHFTRTLATSSVRREILTAYLLTAPICKGYPLTTLPLLHLTGPSGGGKTQTLKLMSTFYHGFPVLSNATVAAFYRMACSEIFVPFDDYDLLPPSLRQLILNTTTGIIRRKSRGSNDTQGQPVHVLMALTSVTPLADEMLRRRALVVEVDRAQWPSDVAYSEEIWKDLADVRSSLWWTYFDFVGAKVLPAVTESRFREVVHTVEESIPLPIFRGLAPFVALMRLVGEELQRVVRFLHLSSLQSWIYELGLTDVAEILDRSPLLNAIAATFEVYDALPMAGDELRHQDFRLRVSAPDTLEGSTTEWLATLRQATKNDFRVRNALELGHAFKRLIGRELHTEPDAKESDSVDVGGYRFRQIFNTGPRKCNRGWRVRALLRKEP